jgi:hypothetical protein
VSLFRRIQRGRCAYYEHIEDLRDLIVEPAAARWRPDAQLTIGALLDRGAMGVHALHGRRRRAGKAATRGGTWDYMLWLGEVTRFAYDDDADLAIEDAITARPGVDVAAWEDNEVVLIGAPSLCPDGVLAAAARALVDPRVKGRTDVPTGADVSDREHLEDYEHLVAVLRAETGRRRQRPGTRFPSMDTLGRPILISEWMAAEHDAMRHAVNDLRVARGLEPIFGDVIARAEAAAQEHSDYVSRYALGCAALTRDSPPA